MSTEINGVPFSVRLLTRHDNRPDRRMAPRYLTVHETANWDDGATADATARYMHNGSGGRQASWHVTTDHLEAIQTLKWLEQGWHAGDGYDGPGNTTSIALEVCVNKDGAERIKAWDNAARIAAYLAERFDLELVQHNKWSGKNCPHDMRSKSYPMSWQDFLIQVEGYREGTPKQEEAMDEERMANLEQKVVGLDDQVEALMQQVDRLNEALVEKRFPKMQEGIGQVMEGLDTLASALDAEVPE